MWSFSDSNSIVLFQQSMLEADYESQCSSAASNIISQCFRSSTSTVLRPKLAPWMLSGQRTTPIAFSNALCTIIPLLATKATTLLLFHDPGCGCHEVTGKPLHFHHEQEDPERLEGIYMVKVYARGCPAMMPVDCQDPAFSKPLVLNPPRSDEHLIVFIDDAGVLVSFQTFALHELRGLNICTLVEHTTDVQHDLCSIDTEYIRALGFLLRPWHGLHQKTNIDQCCAYSWRVIPRNI